MNIKILQEIDGNTYHLRLLQVAQQIGFQFKPEQLKEYYETFECNTEFLKQVNQKVSYYKLIQYISKESENYPVDEEMGCGVYPYHYKNKRNPDIERKRNTTKDWLEYLKWCKALKYDLDNMYIRSYFTASRLADLKIGQKVTVIADFGGDEKFEYPGTITWIAQESEFTPKSIQTNDSRANLVYAVKIAVRNDGRLKLGQYGEVRL